MSRKRVPWDGPHPHVGEYLETRSRDTVWLIRAVTPLPRPDMSGAVLVLELQTMPLVAAIEGVPIHPHHRILPSDALGPPRVRQVQPGPAMVMKSRWGDPEDMRVNARRPREITGWRSWCPLRRAQMTAGSQITERHIAAADHFRLISDLAVFGRSMREGLLPITAASYGPRPDLGASAEQQAKAARDINRALARFPRNCQLMLVKIVLLNQTIYAWCGGARAELNAQMEMGKLVNCLDILADHFGTEVEAALSERLVRAA